MQIRSESTVYAQSISSAFVTSIQREIGGVMMKQYRLDCSDSRAQRSEAAGGGRGAAVGGRRAGPRRHQAAHRRAQRRHGRVHAHHEREVRAHQGGSQ